MAAPASVAVLTPAKINLTLQVLGRRPDGFHDLVSWVAPIGLMDELLVRASSAPGVALACADAGVPADDSNLVVRAARALAREAGIEPRLEVSLRKYIPVAAGLGGGSSDAAATLLALNQLWRLDWPRERLCRIAAEVGSDVSLFLFGTSCVIRGRGERVEPLRRTSECAVVLILPPFGLSTAAVYGAVAPADLGPRPDPDHLMGLRGDALAAALFNDLEPAAFRIEPRLGELRARLERDLGRPVRMTGSGSALFSIFDDAASAGQWRARVEDSLGVGEPRYETRVCATWYSERG